VFTAVGRQCVNKYILMLSFLLSRSAFTETLDSYLSELYLNPFLFHEIWKIKHSSSNFLGPIISKFSTTTRVLRGTGLFVRIFLIRLALQYKTRALTFVHFLTEFPHTSAQ